MQRTVVVTVLFATAAVLATALSSWLLWGRVRHSLQTEFESRLSRIAVTAASQLTPDLVAETRLEGEDSPAYLVVQVQLVTLRAATDVANAVLVDSSRITLVDARAAQETERLTSPLDTLARATLDHALRGEARVTPVYRHDGRLLRAGLAPVRSAAGGVAGVVAVEAEPTYGPVLQGLGQTLAWIAVASALAIGVLAAFFLRAAQEGARLERRLSRSENLAAMGRLTATLAHEIKNPLAIIRGSAERLKAEGPETRRMAEFVIEETDRLSKTVARYLKFARAGDELAETGDALAALDSTLDLLEGEFRERHIALERSRGVTDSVTVRLDPESLKQVYLNLLLNAVEAMPSGGRLSVTDRAASDSVEVSIADEGQGIAPEVLAKIGSPFFTTKARGSGLGLFLTRRLIKSSGGDLEIRSELGKGTFCRIVLPRVGKG